MHNIRMVDWNICGCSLNWRLVEECQCDISSACWISLFWGGIHFVELLLHWCCFSQVSMISIRFPGVDILVHLVVLWVINWFLCHRWLNCDIELNERVLFSIGLQRSVYWRKVVRNACFRCKTSEGEVHLLSVEVQSLHWCFVLCDYADRLFFYSRYFVASVRLTLSERNSAKVWCHVRIFISCLFLYLLQLSFVWSLVLTFQ